MADFFSDLIDSVTNQKVAGQQTIIPTNELLAQSYGALNSQVAPGLLAFNQALAPGLTDVQLGVTNQLDPSILGNLRGANASILEQLNLGSSMSPELQAEITRGLLQTNAASGFGASAGGTGNVLYQTAMDKERLRQQRQQASLGAGTSGFNLSQQLYDPAAYTGLGAQMASGIAGNIQQVQAAQDELANVQENVRRQNFSALINTGGRIAGMVVGGIAGSGNPMAIQAGGNIGGSLGGQTGVAGYGGIGGQQQGIGGGRSDGMFSSFLNFGSMFGGGDKNQGFTTTDRGAATPGNPRINYG